MSVATEDRPFLLLHGGAVVANRYFHFTITALTVYQAGSCRADILQTDLLVREDPHEMDKNV